MQEEQETEEPKWLLRGCFWGILLSATLLAVAATGVSLGMFPVVEQEQEEPSFPLAAREFHNTQLLADSWHLNVFRDGDLSNIMRLIGMSQEQVLLL